MYSGYVVLFFKNRSKILSREERGLPSITELVKGKDETCPQGACHLNSALGFHYHDCLGLVVCLRQFIFMLVPEGLRLLGVLGQAQENCH